MSEKIEDFERDVLLPSFQEVAASSALLRDFSVEIVTKRPSADENAEYLLEQLAGAMRRQAGPSLVLTKNSIPEGLSPLAGRYVLTPFYTVDTVDDMVYASPAVVCWMRFNNKLHVFNHRYDNAIAEHNVEDIARPHVLNHILRSLDFFKLYASSEQPFPGYR